MVYNLEVEFRIFENKLDEKSNLVDKYLISNSSSINVQFDKNKPYFYQHRDLNIITCSKSKNSKELLSEIGLINDLAILEENKSRIINLFSVDYRNHMYFIKPSNEKNKLEIFESSLDWIMINELYDNFNGSPAGLKLKNNDILKLGRIIFKIRETRYSKEVDLDRSKIALFSNNDNKCSKCNLEINSPKCKCQSNDFNKLNIYNISDLQISQIKNEKHINDNERDIDTINFNMLEKKNFINLQTNLNNSEANELIIDCNNNLEYAINNDLDNNINSYKRKNKSYKSSYSVKECRVCLNSENEIENPLINVCKCQGSVGLIHLECLKQWLNNKIVTKIYAFLIVHSFKDLKCEICNSILPERVIINDKVEYLIDLKLPENDNYLILETLSSEIKDVKYLYIIHMPIGTTLLMGRNAECDIRMTDISISRIHAYLENFEGEFFIRDNNSKFGTLIKQQYEMLVLPGKNLAIQYGNSVAYFSLNKSFISYLCCLNDNSQLKTILNYNEYLAYKICPKENSIKTIKLNNIKRNKKSKIDVSISNHNLNENILLSSNDLDYYSVDNDKLILVENNKKVNKDNKSFSYEINVVDLENSISEHINKTNSENAEKKELNHNNSIQNEVKEDKIKSDLILNNLSNLHNTDNKKSLITSYNNPSFNSIKSSVNLNDNLNPLNCLDSDKIINTFESKERSKIKEVDNMILSNLQSNSNVMVKSNSDFLHYPKNIEKNYFEYDEININSYAYKEVINNRNKIDELISTKTNVQYNDSRQIRENLDNKELT